MVIALRVSSFGVRLVKVRVGQAVSGGRGRHVAPRRWVDVELRRPRVPVPLLEEERREELLVVLREGVVV